MAFRYSHTQHLAVGPTFTAFDLLPLCEMLKFDNRITSLDLQRARVGDAGCYALADALPWNTTLRELNISYNDIGERGAVTLARALERCVSLQHILLRGNKIGVLGATAFSRLLRRTPCISFLDLSNNYLRVKGVHELSRALVDRAHARLARRTAHPQRAVTFADGGGGRGADDIGAHHRRGSGMPSSPALLDHGGAGDGDVLNTHRQSTLRHRRHSSVVTGDVDAMGSTSGDGSVSGHGVGWLWGDVHDLVVVG